MAAMTVLFFAAALAMFLLLAQMAKKNEIGIQDGAAVLLKGGIFRKIRNTLLGKALAVMLAVRMRRIVKKTGVEWQDTKENQKKAHGSGLGS